MGSSDVIMMDLTISDANFEEDARKVLKEVRPNWDSESIKFKTFTDGVTNKLMGFYVPKDPEDMVLVRINGVGSDLVIDREEEQKTFSVLNSVGCAPPVYCIFNNGMAYGFFPGEPLDLESVRKPEIQELIAGEMARLHAVKGDYAKKFEGNPPSQYRAKVQSYLDSAPTGFDDPQKQKQFVTTIPDKASLQKEVDELCAHLDACNMKSVFSHNDLLLKNIVYHEKSKTIKFIDYEYGFYNYEAFDIGNHFAEYAGMDDMDYSLYPEREEQLRWVRYYLESAAKIEGKDPNSVTDRDVERMYVLANKCCLASHLFWSVWGLIQAKHSTIDFDYLEFSKTRLDEYFRRKKQFFPLQVPSV